MQYVYIDPDDQDLPDMSAMADASADPPQDCPYRREIISVEQAWQLLATQETQSIFNQKLGRNKESLCTSFARGLVRGLRHRACTKSNIVLRGERDGGWDTQPTTPAGLSMPTLS